MHVPAASHATEQGDFLSTTDSHDAPQEPDAIAAELGSRLREVRQRRRETLAVVADRTQLTRGFLSKLENGQTSISVGALLRLCAALEIELAELLAWPSGRLITRANRQPLAFGGSGMQEFLLTPNDEHRIQVHLTEIEPGGGSGDDAYQLPVQVEFVTVLDGTLEVTVNKTKHQLGTGDSLTFASAPHTFTNPGSTRARVLWVLAPAISVPSTQTPIQL